MAYCRKCRTRIDDEAVICPYCETPQQESPVYHNSSAGQSSEGSFSSGSLVFIAIALIILGLMGLIVPPKGLVLTIPCFAVAIAAVVTVIKRKREHYKMITDMSRAAAEKDDLITKKAAEPAKMWSFAEPDSVSTSPKTQTTASSQKKLSAENLAEFIGNCTIKYNAELAEIGKSGIHDTTISFEIGETADADEHIKRLKEKVMEAIGGKLEDFCANITIGSGEDIYVTVTQKEIIASRYNNLITWKDVKYDPPSKHIGENFIISDAGLAIVDRYDYDYSDTQEKYFCFIASPQEGIYWCIYADRTQFDWLLTALKKGDPLLGNIVVKAEFPESTKRGLVTLVNLEIDMYGACYVTRI